MASTSNSFGGDQIMRDADPACKFKQMDVVRASVKQSNLSAEQKTLLDQLLQQEDPNLLEVINRSNSSDHLLQGLTAFVRARMAESTAAPMVVDSPPSTELFDAAFKKLSTNKAAVIASACRNIQKMLQNLRKSPTNVTFRKLRMEHIVVKKFVTDVPGALEFMQAVGFSVVEEKKVKYLNIEAEAVNAALLDKAIELLEDKIRAAEAPAPAAPAVKDGHRALCTAGCGFFGDPETEGMCSQCARKKNLGSGAPVPGGAAKAGEVKTAAAAAAAAPQRRCTEGCGFWGLDKFNGMCSKCFTAKGGVLPPPSTAKLPEKKGWRKRFPIIKLKLRAIHRLTMGKKGKTEQKDKKRCWKCNKKVGITGIECRCMYVFCGKHRYPDEHNCPFDYRHLQRLKLGKENAQVKAQKFEKIEDQ